MTDDREAGRGERPSEDPPAPQQAPSSQAPSSGAPSGSEAGGDTAATPSDGRASAGSQADGTAPDGTAPDTGAAASVESRRQRKKRLKAEQPRRKAPWWELPLLVAIAIGIAIVVKTFVIQPFYIPSDSMERTLHGCPGCSGDRILVNKPVYSLIRDPEPGDIVVFDAPKGWDTEDTSVPPSNPVVRAVRGFGQLIGFVPPDGQVLVKRVIAVGGQTVKGDGQGHVMISTSGKDGPYRTLDEPYVYAPGGNRQDPFGPVTVPKDRLWVMGDHRTDSADSRYHCSPDEEGTADDRNCDATSSTVPVDNVIGKAIVIAWPPSRWTTLGTPSTFETAAAVAGPALPAVAPLATVVPVLLVRRRRRR
ncbi:S26 family signal peptidase [Jatrophihabitans fulvus]